MTEVMGFNEVSMVEMYAVDGGFDVVQITVGALQVVAGVFVTTGGVAACSNPLTAAAGVGLAVGGVVVTGVGVSNIIQGFKN
jgi:hypothetical protein